MNEFYLKTLQQYIQTYVVSKEYTILKITDTLSLTIRESDDSIRLKRNILTRKIKAILK